MSQTAISPLPANTSIPRPEHPRPDFQRQPWLNLNGVWRFSFDPRNVGEQKRWHRVTHPDLKTTIGILNSDPFGDQIVVPFPWQSQLSGIADTEYKGAAWYQRILEVPAEWGEADAAAGPHDARGLPGIEESATSATAPGANVTWKFKPFLCFGAVDWCAKIWIGGRFVGEHYGGYTPFALDISRYVRPGKPATLTVRVYDACDADTLLGKQTEEWYTPSGGIWQTVWLEGRPAAYIDHLQITPNLGAGTATFAVSLVAEEQAAAIPYALEIVSPDSSFPSVKQSIDLSGGATQTTLEVSVPNPKTWSPEAPHLYDCAVRLTPQHSQHSLASQDPSGSQNAEEDARTPLSDEVLTYFGLRHIARGRWKDKPYEYVLLNNEPVYLRGALDQAFHPHGLHTYPTDDAIRADVQAAKDLGLNMLRCHIKINEPRYYYWADRLGVLMMYDIPSASLYTPTARANWEATFRAAFQRDASHPCIFAWILFNETWGLEEHQTPASWNWVREMVDTARSLDSTRLVEDNSACLYDHVLTDLNTWHFYIGNYDRARRHVERVVAQTYAGSPFNYVGHLYSHVDDSADFKQESEPLLNSEYAGLGADGGDKDISYTFKFLTTELRRHPKIGGYVYTELADIEWEHNGLMNYDRTSKEFGYEAFLPGMSPADINGADFVGLDCPPCVTVAPGTILSVPVFVSHWDKRALETAWLCWRVSLIDRFGENRISDEGKRAIAPQQYDVTETGTLEVRCPQEIGLLTIAVWIEDQTQNVRARNYVNVDVYADHQHPAVEKTGLGYALRFQPGDFVDTSRANPTIGADGNKFVCGGPGWIDYQLPLPPEIADGVRVQRLRLRFEAATRSAMNRIGWKRTWRDIGASYPQTESRKHAGDILVSINGIMIGKARLPDDPADARGVLSAHLYENFEFASYGFLTTLDVDQETAQRIVSTARGGELILRFEVPRAGVSNGLNLYGARMGGISVAPTLFIDLE